MNAIAALTFEEAKRKARYGRKSYVGYGPKEHRTYELLSRDGIKRALLATGTQGRFIVIDANTGITNLTSWRLGTQMLRNIRWILAA